MISPRSIASFAVLPLLVSACCSEARPRFWKVRDASGGATAYTVDTLAVPTTSLVPRDIRYIGSSGNYTDLAKPKMVREMTEQEWKLATSGARYSLYYCGHRKGCWAKAKDR